MQIVQNTSTRWQKHWKHTTYCRGSPNAHSCVLWRLCQAEERKLVEKICFLIGWLKIISMYPTPESRSYTRRQYMVWAERRSFHLVLVTCLTGLKLLYWQPRTMWCNLTFPKRTKRQCSAIQSNQTHLLIMNKYLKLWTIEIFLRGYIYDVIREERRAASAFVQHRSHFLKSSFKRFNGEWTMWYSI